MKQTHRGKQSRPVSLRSWPFSLFSSIVLVALLGCVHAAPWSITGAERVVAISDVHGAYDGMLRTLKHAGVIDDEQSWIAGATKLVITGDLLDRGADSRKVMDLVMALERQAALSGGAVHLLLGNHEVMNLVGDLRYVSRGEYAAFAGDENAAERQRWFEYFRSANADVADEATLRADFDKKAPPGFFAHRRAFRPDGHYGKWLLQKPLLLVIDETAFVHGGLSPMIEKLGLDGVNTLLAAELRAYSEAVGALNDAGLLSPTENFYYHPELLKPMQQDAALSGELRGAIAAVIELNDSDIHSSQGPLWYRGNVACSALTESDKLDRVLQTIGATRVVIGHTPTMTRRVLQRLDGKVIEIDTGMLTAAYKGSGNALVIEGDSLAVINESGAASDGPVPHPRHVGARRDTLSAADLEEAMTRGVIAATGVDESGRTIVSVKSDAGNISAVFSKNPRSKGFVPEVAAYRLDRLLSLDMVPVTVLREMDGQAGSLQFLPEKASDETKRAAGRLGGDAWCPLNDQWSSMYVFDALIFNPGRQPQAILYSPDNWQLMLSGHQDSFTTHRDRPPGLRSVELPLGTAWVKALQSVDDASLQAELGDVLDKRRLAALSKRRDQLLEDAKN
ncbi:MAG: metallophosphoesterase [Gammaproteobacteria bacterium]|nr:metallophosphoesterase [Gammaproteobacteria bacterium]